MHETDAPLVQLLACVTACRNQDPDEMCERALPNAKFKLMHLVWHEELEDVLFKCRKLFGKRRLSYKCQCTAMTITDARVIVHGSGASKKDRGP